MLDNVEAHCLGERAALANCDDVTLFDDERRREVRRNVAVALLVTAVLGKPMKVVTANDDGPLHFGGGDGATEDAATDRDVAGEGAFVVDIIALDGAPGCAVAEADVLVETEALAFGLFGLFILR